MAAKKEQTEEIELLLSRFQPGDVAILQSRVPLTKDQMTSLTHQFKALVPQIKCVILNSRVRVSRMQQEQEE